MAIETQEPDLATLVIWSALCRKLGGTAKIVWSDDRSASGYCEPLKEGICSWIDDQNYLPTSPEVSSSSGDPIAERKNLVAQLFRESWPILIVENPQADIDFTDIIEDESGMRLKTDTHLIFPSIQMISEVGKIIGSYPNSKDPLIALSFTSDLSTIEEMVVLLNQNKRPLILPNYHDTSPNNFSRSSLAATTHDFFHFLRQNRPYFNSQDLKISLKWINLIHESVTALDLPGARLNEVPNSSSFERYLDLELNTNFGGPPSLFEYISDRIHPKENPEAQTDPNQMAAFRIITDLYLKTPPNEMVNQFGLGLTTLVSVGGQNWNSPTLQLRALLLRQDNPFRNEVTPSLQQ